MYRVQKELIENGNGKAEFDFSFVTAFRVVGNVSQQFFEEGFGTETTQENEGTTQKLPRNYPEKAQEKLKKSQRKISEELMDLLVSEPYLSVRQIAERLDKTEDSIRYHLRKMTEKGIIKHEGATKSGKWVIKTTM